MQLHKMVYHQNNASYTAMLLYYKYICVQRVINLTELF